MDKKLKPKRHAPIVYYVCRHGFSYSVKIGTTTNLKATINKYLEGKKPAKIVFIAAELGGKRLQKRIHEQFKQANMDGEWFHLTPKLKAYMDSLEDITGDY